MLVGHRLLFGGAVVSELPREQFKEAVMTTMSLDALRCSHCSVRATAEDGHNSGLAATNVGLGSPSLSQRSAFLCLPATSEPEGLLMLTADKNTDRDPPPGHLSWGPFL